MFGLPPWQAQVIDEWFNNNFNNRLAFLKIKPESSLESADSSMSRLLNDDRAKAYIEFKKEERRKRSEVTLDYLVDNLKKIVADVAMEEVERTETGRLICKPDRTNMIKAIDLLSKLTGYQDIRKNVELKQTEPLSIKINIIPPKDGTES
jgi:hypothetical protein